MSVGEGIKIAAIIGGLGVAGWLFGIAAGKIGTAWGEMVAAELADQARASRGSVPDAPADPARPVPGEIGCGCPNCRRRYNQEPCSDFDD